MERTSVKYNFTTWRYSLFIYYLFTQKRLVVVNNENGGVRLFCLGNGKVDNF
jgi:hypothetical protein